MRLRDRLILPLTALLLGACAKTLQPNVALPVSGTASTSDMLWYGKPSLTARSAVDFRHANPGSQASTIDESYKLDTGDKLRIFVFGLDALSNTYTVGADGTVSLPLVGAVKSRGLSTSLLSSAIAARLNRDLVINPSVSVEIETYRPFFILGEVKYPGRYPFVPGMTSQEAIAIAGGYTPRANRRSVTVARKIEIRHESFEWSLSQRLLPGDAVTVSERWF
jgi:polysaccharide export outer membrane protein